MKKVFLIALILIIIRISVYSQGIRLAVNLPEGYRYNTESTVDLYVEQEFMGIRYSTKMEINTLMFTQVMGVDADSNYILSASYQKMNIRVYSLLINMEVNSESTLPGDSLSIILRSLQGKEFKILLSRNGQFSDISELDEMISETIASAVLPEKQKAEFTRNLIQSLGKEVLLDNYSGNKSFYPDFTVKAPAQWDFQYSLVKSGIPMELNSHIKLKSISRNVAVMVSEGKIGRQNLPFETIPIPSINNLSGNEVAEIKMDVKTGLVTESIVSQNISGTIKTLSELDNVNEIIIPFKIISRSTIKTIPLK